MYKYQGIGNTSNVVKLTKRDVYGIIKTSRKKKRCFKCFTMKIKRLELVRKNHP